MVHSMLSCCGVMMLYMLYIVSFSDANIFVPQVFALCTFFQVHSFYLTFSCIFRKGTLGYSIGSIVEFQWGLWLLWCIFNTEIPLVSLQPSSPSSVPDLLWISLYLLGLVLHTLVSMLISAMVLSLFCTASNHSHILPQSDPLCPSSISP